MSTVSRSPRKVAAVALEVGTRKLPRYGHRFSRKDFTQPQLFACLVLRKFFNTDYRRIVAYLDDWPALRRDLKLAKVPHFTTLQKAEARLLRDPQVRHLLSGTVAMFYHHDEPTSSGGSSARPKDVERIDQTARDSTGFETARASRYFIRRRQRGQNARRNPLYQTTTYRRFAKLGITVDCDSHLILATHRTTGPHPDVDHLAPLMAGFVDNALPACMLLDAGYDSEANHRLLREKLGCESWIPPTIGRPTSKLPTTKWRYLMATAFDEEQFGQRWQSETVMYMLKQHQGDALTARKYQTRRRKRDRSNYSRCSAGCRALHLMRSFIRRGIVLPVGSLRLTHPTCFIRPTPRLITW
jgi:hypothetical protein